MRPFSTTYNLDRKRSFFIYVTIVYPLFHRIIAIVICSIRDADDGKFPIAKRPFGAISGRPAGLDARRMGRLGKPTSLGKQ